MESPLKREIGAKGWKGVFSGQVERRAWSEEGEAGDRWEMQNVECRMQAALDAPMKRDRISEEASRRVSEAAGMYFRADA